MPMDDTVTKRALDFEDLQHFLLARTPALAARYEFLHFPGANEGRAWLAGLLEKVGSARSVGGDRPDARWVTVAFTWNGLKALGVDEASLATFPQEFREGMAARAGILGLTGANAPEHWVGGLAGADLHAIVVLFARDVAERDRCRLEHERFVGETGVRVLSNLDLEALPPFDYAHEHFGYRDRLSQPVVHGTDVQPTPGTDPPVKAGEFFLGYTDETGLEPALPQPEALSRNGSYVAYFRMQEHVGTFRAFLRQHGSTPEEQELVAAKLMGRWRSGAPLVLAPEHDDPALGADMQRNNDFEYAAQDPQGLACPLGAHIRRANPRDALNTQGISTVRRHRILQAGTLYGPPLPEGAPDDGVDRGIMFLCVGASIRRQFEFVHNVWMNDGVFVGLGSAKDPITGAHDAADFMVIPNKPIRRRIQGLPRFVRMRGGEYFFLPSLAALGFIVGAE